jgi:hypothetical protein
MRMKRFPPGVLSPSRRNKCAAKAVLQKNSHSLLYVAIGALRAIHHLGLTVPGDFSVIGFDTAS